MPESTMSTAKATVVAKVTRADGTEETFVSNDVTVTDASAVEALLQTVAPDPANPPPAPPAVI